VADAIVGNVDCGCTVEEIADMFEMPIGTIQAVLDYATMPRNIEAGMRVLLDHNRQLAEELPYPRRYDGGMGVLADSMMAVFDSNTNLTWTTGGLKKVIASFKLGDARNRTTFDRISDEEWHGRLG